MSTVNSVHLIGYLGRDPETKYFDNGGSVCSFPVATTNTWKNKKGEKQERTHWHNIVAKRENLVEVCDEWLKKGSKVYVEGSLQYRSYENSEGETKYITEVVINQMSMQDSRTEEKQEKPSKRSKKPNRSK